jgi:hypothetical protein
LQSLDSRLRGNDKRLVDVERGLCVGALEYFEEIGAAWLFRREPPSGADGMAMERVVRPQMRDVAPGFDGQRAVRRKQERIARDDLDRLRLGQRQSRHPSRKPRAPRHQIEVEDRAIA